MYFVDPRWYMEQNPLQDHLVAIGKEEVVDLRIRVSHAVDRLAYLRPPTASYTAVTSHTWPQLS